MDRRDFLKWLGSSTALLLGACDAPGSFRQPFREAPERLNIYSWADYIHPDTIPEFEKRYGIKVVYDTFSSNEALLAKLQAGVSQYDIIVPTGYMVMQFRKLEALSEIEHDRLPLLRNMMPRFSNPAFDPGLRFSVPYTWGTTGIGFNSGAFPDENEWPTDWHSFWSSKVAHRMTLLDDGRETIGMALKKNAISYNTGDKIAIEAAAKELNGIKANVMCFTSDQVIVQLAAGDSWLALAYSGDVFQAARDNPSVRYVIPASGASLWLDSMCIPAAAPHKENAYKWLNFMLEPEIAAANAAHTRYATPNQAALPLIEESQRTNPNLYPSEKLLSKCDELGDVGPLVFLYDRLWTELKCS